jgi:hypothetical protein
VLPAASHFRMQPRLRNAALASGRGDGSTERARRFSGIEPPKKPSSITLVSFVEGRERG